MAPMSHHVIEASAHSNASRDAVWALIRDIETWQDWGTWSSTTIETPAPGDDPQGVGVIRRLRQAPVTNIERVTELVPNERLASSTIENFTIVDPNVEVEVGGGIDAATTPAAVRAWARVLVAGSSVFHAKDGVAAGMRRLRDAAM